MRSDLRSALATAVLAGAALTPAVTAAPACAADGPAPAAGTASAAREHLRTEKPAGGLVAEVFTTGDGRFVADVFRDGTLLSSLTSGDEAVRGRFAGVAGGSGGHEVTGGVEVTLAADGALTWRPLDQTGRRAAPALPGTGSGTDSTGGAAPQGGTGPAAPDSTTQTTIVPEGGVAAGAEVQEGDHLMLVAGAGAAALGAAGLGFVALRRRTSGTRA
ncbi:hypothetical protein ACIRD2_31055 [Streptomyces sp. NPDC093595]|uniref:hypothetical protein n=1 Tax=Streptomyces sp. NPDC093595 TaxID=3366045 RepID=UPI0037FA593C